MNLLSYFPTADNMVFLAIVTLTFLLAGLVKGVVGLGLPTLAVGLLSMAMTPAQAASILIVPSLVTNVWQLAAGTNFRILLLRLWTMLLGIVLGTLAGGMMLSQSGSSFAMIGLGSALILYAIVGLTSIRMLVPRRAEFWLSPFIGALTGIVTAATGVFVIPAVPYLQGLGLARDELIQALGLAFTASTIALWLGLMANGTFELNAAGISFYALVPALAGMLLGQWVRNRIRPETFRRCFFFGLLALGLHLALR